MQKINSFESKQVIGGGGKKRRCACCGKKLGPVLYAIHMRIWGRYRYARW